MSSRSKLTVSHVGHTIMALRYIPQLRKLVFEFCDKWPSSSNTRSYLLNHLQPLATRNPNVEIVVKQRNHKEPIVRGFYGSYHLFIYISPHSLTLFLFPFQSITVIK